MNIDKTLIAMIEYAKGNTHDINHFLKVYSFARIIGRGERLSPSLQQTLELAAIVHDISCELCRRKYGNTNGHYQEIEGEKLADDFLKRLGWDGPTCGRVSFLVAHHHSYDQVDNLDYQILLEADFLVNIAEAKMTIDRISNIKRRIFKTATGLELLDSIYFSKD